MRGGRGRRRCDIHPVARCSSSSRVLNGCSGWGTQHLAEWIFILTFHGHSFGGRLQNPSGKGQGDNQNGEKHNYQEAKLAFTPLLELTQRNTQQQKNVTRIRFSTNWMDANFSLYQYKSEARNYRSNQLPFPSPNVKPVGLLYLKSPLRALRFKHPRRNS